MVKITKNNRITIPTEIMTLKEWKVGTHVIIMPVKASEDELTRATSIEIRELKKSKK